MCLSGHTTTFPTASSQTSHKHNGKHAIASLSLSKGIPEKLHFRLKSNKISLLDLYEMHPSN